MALSLFHFFFWPAHRGNGKVHQSAVLPWTLFFLTEPGSDGKPQPYHCLQMVAVTMHPSWDDLRMPAVFVGPAASVKEGQRAVPSPRSAPVPCRGKTVTAV